MAEYPPVRRIKYELLQAGDIVLTSAQDQTSLMVQAMSQGLVSHAMICVENASVIDSSDNGVQAWNVQREMYGPDDRIFVLRLREPANHFQIGRIVDYARSEIGARYSAIEAARAVRAGPKPNSRQQFCSRLVSRAYAHVSIKLVADPDYCTPEQLRLSPLLFEVADMTEAVSDAELAAWEAHPNPLARMREMHNTILNKARELDPSVETFTDVDDLIQAHPEWDREIADVFTQCGYLDYWREDYAINPWHYNLGQMNAAADKSNEGQIRDYCIATIKEFDTGGLRYAANLKHYELSLERNGRQTMRLLAQLYTHLVNADHQRRTVALNWLKLRFPDDAKTQIQRIEPHSDLWFSIVDRVEPNLGALARVSIKHAGGTSDCSVCGDPATDYRVVNNHIAMPGVPSLRLCADCAEIRRSGGEILELLN